LENGWELNVFIRSSNDPETETEQLAGCSSDFKDSSSHGRVQLEKITAINNVVIVERK
jgi:hypothetical protein